MTQDSVGLGRAIQTVRTGLGLSRGELAERSGLSYPYVSEIEAGKKQPSTRALGGIADALGMRSHELLELGERFEGAEPVEVMQSVAMMAPLPPAMSASGRPGRKRSRWFAVESREEAKSSETGPRQEAHQLLDEVDESDVGLAVQFLRRLLR